MLSLDDSFPDFHDLVRRACDRDEFAATELVRRFEPELRRVIRFRLTDAGLRRLFDSLDVCQSVMAAFFAQLYAGTIRLDQPRQMAGLLALMARHKVIDRARQYRSQRRGGGAMPAGEDNLARVAEERVIEPSEKAAGVDLLGVVRSRLTGQDREILDLWLTGREWNEIAGRLGGSPDALRKRLSRAIDEIAAQLGLVESSA